jgi:Asp-tRNA(Asn)/Glu-tRNA(Gln) amidotransferase A subunit family amidase
MPSKISDIHGPEWTINVNGQKVSQFFISSKNADVASAANLPAICLPTSSMSTKDHLPIGMEIAAFTGYDRHLISISRALEKVVKGHMQ